MPHTHTHPPPPLSLLSAHQWPFGWIWSADMTGGDVPFSITGCSISPADLPPPVTPLLPCTRRVSAHDYLKNCPVPSLDQWTHSSQSWCYLSHCYTLVAPSSCPSKVLTLTLRALQYAVWLLQSSEACWIKYLSQYVNMLNDRLCNFIPIYSPSHTYDTRKKHLINGKKKRKLKCISFSVVCRRPPVWNQVDYKNVCFQKETKTAVIIKICQSLDTLNQGSSAGVRDP